MLVGNARLTSRKAAFLPPAAPGCSQSLLLSHEQINTNRTTVLLYVQGPAHLGV